MTRKDYELIARAIAAQLEWFNMGVARGAIVLTAQSLAREFAKDNPFLDTDTFLKACGVTRDD